MNGTCTTCGAELINGVCPRCSGLSGGSQAQSPADDARFKGFFMNPTEKFVCALGNSYLQNFLSNGSFGNGFAVLSDMRVYFKGKSFELNTNNKFNIKTVSSAVDLKDVTGTEVRTISNPALMFIGIMTFISALGLFILAAVDGSAVWGVLAGLMILAGIFSIVMYYKARMTMITIMFGGGGMAFPINWFSAQESDNFQRLLRITKDNAVKQAENAAANAMREVVAAAAVQQQQQQQPAVSSADELAKYAQLYKDGIISEQEFADIKARILSKQV